MPASTAVKAKAAGDSGRLFGSITAGDIVDAVRAAGGPALDKRAVEVSNQIKTVGKHPVTVRLHPEVTTQVEIAVVAELSHLIAEKGGTRTACPALSLCRGEILTTESDSQEGCGCARPVRAAARRSPVEVAHGRITNGK